MLRPEVTKLICFVEATRNICTSFKYKINKRKKKKERNEFYGNRQKVMSSMYYVVNEC